MPYLTVFIPAYNEEGNLAHCVETVLTKLDELNVALEILIVDDGSQDGTYRVASELASRDARVRIERHPTNQGIGGAFRTALEQARGEWLILIPADLAIDPGELHRYIDTAPQADIVVGLRSDRSDYTPARRIVSWTNIHLIQTLFGMRVQQSQYISMYRMSVFQQIRVEFWRSAFFLAEILVKAQTLGFRLVEVEIRYAPRLTGRATGAKLMLILKTVRDIFRFWLRWVFLGPVNASQYKPGNQETDKQDENNQQSLGRKSGEISNQGSTNNHPHSPISNQQSKKRPAGVTLLAGGVLILVGFNLVRMVQAIKQWSFLSSLPSVHPWYQVLTGLVWSVVFLPLFFRLWNGWRKTPLLTFLTMIAYTVYAWLDRIFLAKQVANLSSVSNWPFIVGLTIILLLLSVWILTRRKARAFFGDVNERKFKNTRTAG